MSVYHLRTRNAEASKSIARRAEMHRTRDAIIGAAGFLPIPGAGPMSIVASIAAGVPIYRSLARDLSIVYKAPRDAISEALVGGGIVADAGGTVAAELIGQFGVDFLQELGSEFLLGAGVGFAASAIPVLGGLFSVGLDMALAATMTWTVGTMISMYYQHGERWIDDRNETCKWAKSMVGGLSPAVEDRVDLDDIPKKTPEILEWRIAEAFEIGKGFVNAAPTATLKEVRKMLRDLEFTEEQIDEAVRRVAAYLSRKRRDQ
jgi:hypothetical protein